MLPYWQKYLLKWISNFRPSGYRWFIFRRLNELWNVKLNFGGQDVSCWFKYYVAVLLYGIYKLQNMLWEPSREKFRIGSFGLWIFGNYFCLTVGALFKSDKSDSRLHSPVLRILMRLWLPPKVRYKVARKCNLPRKQMIDLRDARMSQYEKKKRCW